MSKLTNGNKYQVDERLRWASYHWNQLNGLAVELACLLDVAPGTSDAKDLRSVMYGEICIDEAMQRIINRKPDELSTIEVDGVIDQTA